MLQIQDDDGDNLSLIVSGLEESNSTPDLSPSGSARGAAHSAVVQIVTQQPVMYRGD